LSDADLKRLLVDQQPVITSDIRQLAEWVVRGRYPIAIGVSNTDLTRFQQEGVAHNVRPIDLAIERVSPSWGGVMLMNRAPHANATRVFLNWLLGQNAQKLWAETGDTNSRRLDVPPGEPDTAPDPKKLPKYLSASTEENAAMREDAMALAKSLLK
jgi:iron(III) transport system substrate-binding protein